MKLKPIFSLPFLIFLLQCSAKTNYTLPPKNTLTIFKWSVVSESYSRVLAEGCALKEKDVSMAKRIKFTAEKGSQVSIRLELYAVNKAIFDAPKSPITDEYACSTEADESREQLPMFNACTQPSVSTKPAETITYINDALGALFQLKINDSGVYRLLDLRTDSRCESYAPNSPSIAYDLFAITASF
jgi:hypothetical protein